LWKRVISQSYNKINLINLINVIDVIKHHVKWWRGHNVALRHVKWWRGHNMVLRQITSTKSQTISNDQNSKRRNNVLVI